VHSDKIRDASTACNPTGVTECAVRVLWTSIDSEIRSYGTAISALPQKQMSDPSAALCQTQATLIDTSGDYGEGRSEELIKRVIAGQRDRAFVVSKVEADEVTGDAMARTWRALPGSVLIISIFICCTGQLRTATFPRS
jgi:hypothetical protein